jgi:hypothetical protein
MVNKERFLDICKNIKRTGFDKLLEWLEKTDFYIAPASTKYHLAYEGGLTKHSINVYNWLVELTKNNKLNWADEDSIAIVALFHDLCKLGVYKPVPKFKKDDKNKWVEYIGYEFDEDLPLGHGEKSVMLLQNFIKLTPEEIFCIRWHMGAYEGEKNWNVLRNAIHKYPNVFWTNCADMLASLDEDNEEENNEAL